MLASVFLADCRRTLIDTAKAAWSDADLLACLNDAISMACGTFGDLYVVADDEYGLEPGVRQQLPADGVLLIDIPFNGEGTSVVQQSVAELSRVHPNWAAQTPVGGVRFFMYDPRSPSTFLVFPAASSGAFVSIVYGAVPAAVVLEDQLPLPDWTHRALWALVLSKAYAKNSQRQDLAKAKDYLAMGMAIFDKWAENKRAKAAPVDIKGVH